MEKCSSETHRVVQPELSGEVRPDKERVWNKNDDKSARELILRPSDPGHERGSLRQGTELRCQAGRRARGNLVRGVHKTLCSGSHKVRLNVNSS